MLGPSSAHRARGEGEEKKIQSNVSRERENSAPAFLLWAHFRLCCSKSGHGAAARTQAGCGNRLSCLRGSNKRSSRSAGAHWRTHSPESSAQSQDPQSPQPIRGYTGGPELLVGGAKRGDETRPETCSPSDGPARRAVPALQSRRGLCALD